MKCQSCGIYHQNKNNKIIKYDLCSKCEFGVQVLNVFFKSLIDYKSGQTKLSNREWINKLLELCDTDI